jgi:hypothetical protein
MFKSVDPEEAKAQEGLIKHGRLFSIVEIGQKVLIMKNIMTIIILLKFHVKKQRKISFLYIYSHLVVMGSTKIRWTAGRGVGHRMLK